MIPNTKDRELVSSGVTGTQEFSISVEDSAHIMTILRDTLYSDKVLAVLREYSSNAWDAHRMCGKNDLPIKIVLPTPTNPTLSIRDYGTGLSHDDVFNVFTKYGASTKREDDTAVGMLGIGSKSGFAYSDSFTITSWNDSKKRSYVAVLDESEKGVINLLNEAPCKKEDTGVLIQIAVRQEDIWEFQNKAKNLFKYFIPRPTINVELPPKPSGTPLKNGILNTDNSGEWIAVMGCIPYTIDDAQIFEKEFKGASAHLKSISGVLFFDIGEVQISASREALKYSNLTKRALVNKINALIDEFVTTTITQLDSITSSTWEKRLGAQILGKLELPVPDSYNYLTQSYVPIEEDTTTFNIYGSSRLHPIKHITITKRTRLLLQDTDKEIRGYNLESYDYVVVRDKDCDWAVVEKELADVLSIMKLDGIPIDKLSNLKWIAPSQSGRRRYQPKRYANVKHRVKKFRLIPSHRSHSVKSKCWEIDGSVPNKDDVFVIINEFRSVGHNIFIDYEADAKLAEAFKVVMPSVYGYKTTTKKPLTPVDCVGIHYPEWRKQFVRSLVTDEVKEKFERFEWLRVMKASEGGWHHIYDINDDSIKLITNKLGPDHKITHVVTNIYNSRTEFDTDVNYRNNLDYLASRLKDINESIKTTQDIEGQFNSLLDAYPLLKEYELNSLWNRNASLWLDYVKLEDNKLKGQNDGTT